MVCIMSVEEITNIERRKEIRDKTWIIALDLWKNLANTPNVSTTDAPSEFKNKMLKKLGYQSQRSGCPFCTEYSNTTLCPLGNCSEIDACMIHTPYSAWHVRLLNTNAHDQKLAEEFYTHLMVLKEMADE